MCFRISALATKDERRRSRDSFEKHGGMAEFFMVKEAQQELNSGTREHDGAVSQG